MKLNLSTFVLALAMLLSASASAMASDWITFKSDAGRFSVLMPGPENPKADSKTTPQSAAGPYTTHLFMQPGANGLFMVGYVDYAPTFNFDKQKEMEANRDNFIKGLPGTTLISQRAITMGTNPGMEFTAAADNYTLKARIYIVGKRPYMLIALTWKGVDDSVNVEKFFSSFKVNAAAASARPAAVE